MDAFVIQLVVDTLLPWLLFSYLVYICTSYFTKDSNASPSIWWLALVISFLPLVPFSFGDIEVTLSDFDYLSFGLNSAQIATQASITHADLNGSDVITILFLISYLGISSFKLFRLRGVWMTLKKILTTTESIDSNKVTKISTVVSPSNHSPFVFGTVKPQIVLPNYFLTLEASQQRILIQHELTHIASRDHIAILSWRVLNIFLWINPLVKKMEWQFIRAMEHRCDNLTIERYKINKHLYASTLLESLKRCVNHGDLKPVAQFNSGALCADDYKVRLTNIIRPRGQDSHFMFIKWLPLIIALCCLLTIVKEANVTDELNWQHPLENYRVSSSFLNISKIRNYKPHQGVDYVAQQGSLVRSAADGIVVVADNSTLSPNYGNTVLIQHKGGYQTLYSHLDSIEVEAGSWVGAGESVGVIGDTGRTTGVHLHFEIIKDKQRVNPIDFLGE